MTGATVEGVGLGLRRAMLSELTNVKLDAVDFFEVAPENWVGVGGRMGRQLRQISEHTPINCHGLSLSIGGTSPLDKILLKDIKAFLNELNVPIYSEHLSYSNDGGHLYDLLPLPFTEEAVQHVAGRIREVQEFLERRIAIENISYYLVPEQDMSEAEFINAVLEEADCDLLLDVNNVYVNSQNHNYDPLVFLKSIRSDRTTSMHMAGHFVEPDGVIIDTHGADVIDPVWALLDETYQLVGAVPTLLERDFNLPEMNVLTQELARIKCAQTVIKKQKRRAHKTPVLKKSALV